jgi:hypothetical protein
MARQKQPSPWLERLKRERSWNVVVVALANKAGSHCMGHVGTWNEIPAWESGSCSRLSNASDKTTSGCEARLTCVMAEQVRPGEAKPESAPERTARTEEDYPFSEFHQCQQACACSKAWI